MPRYINADLLKIEAGVLIALKSSLTPHEVFDLVNKQPAADVRENVHGKWIAIHDDVFADTYKCSECGKSAFCNDYGWCLTRYCPNCGARMEVEDAKTN